MRGFFEGAGLRLISRARCEASEREFRRVLQDHLTVKRKRNLGQTNAAEHDLFVSGDASVSMAANRFAFEVRRCRSITQAMLAKFWEQAKRKACKAKKMPALAYRGTLQTWRVMVPLAAISEAFPWQSFDCAIDMDIRIFATIILERRNDPRKPQQTSKETPQGMR